MRPNSRALFFVLFVCLSLLAVGAGFVLHADQTQNVSAKNGLLDLRGHDFDQQPSINFGGEWAFYWQQQLEPQDFAAKAAPQPDAFLSLPGDWQGLVVKEQPLGGTGHATLRLTVLNDPVQEILALRIGAIYSAYRLWANGKVVAESGRIGTSLAEETMEHSLRIAPLQLDGAPIELVLQVSSFHLDRTSLPALGLG